jgi:anti-sigma factor (TIGR02949 family)
MTHSKNTPGTTRPGIGCLEAIEKLYAWLDGELNDDASVEDFEHHLSHCRSCYSRAEMEQALTDHIKKTEKSRASDALKSRLRDLLEEI